MNLLFILSAEEEDGKTIAQANAEYDDKGNFTTDTCKSTL